MKTYCAIVTLAFLTSLTIAETTTVSGKVEKIEMTIDNSINSGGNSAYIKLLQDDVACQTEATTGFSKGSTLVWRGSTLDTCQGKEFDLLKDKINFATMSNHGDDYWPTTLKITMNYDGKDVEYEAKNIGEWVDNGKNNYFRIATRTSEIEVPTTTTITTTTTMTTTTMKSTTEKAQIDKSNVGKIGPKISDVDANNNQTNTNLDSGNPKDEVNLNVDANNNQTDTNLDSGNPKDEVNLKVDANNNQTDTNLDSGNQKDGVNLKVDANDNQTNTKLESGNPKNKANSNPKSSAGKASFQIISLVFSLFLLCISNN